ARRHALLLRGADAEGDRRGARRDRVARLAAAHEGGAAREGAALGRGGALHLRGLSRARVRQLEPDEARARTAELAALLREAVDAGMALGQLAPVDTEQAFAEMIEALEPGERMLFGAFVDEELVGTAQLERAAPANSRHRAEVMRLVVRGDAKRQGVGRELMQIGRAHV